MLYHMKNFYCDKNVKIERLENLTWKITIFNNILFEASVYTLLNTELIDNIDLQELSFNIRVNNIDFVSDISINNNNYNIANRLIDNIFLQFSIYNQYDYSVEYLHPKYILSLDNNSFIIVNGNILHSISNDHMKITKPFTKNQYMAPEQLIANNLPLILHKNVSLYSAGIITTKILTGNIANYNNIKVILNEIMYTPLYYKLERCIKETPNDRNLIII